MRGNPKRKSKRQFSPIANLKDFTDVWSRGHNATRRSVSLAKSQYQAQSTSNHLKKRKEPEPDSEPFKNTARPEGNFPRLRDKISKKLKSPTSQYLTRKENMISELVISKLNDTRAMKIPLVSTLLEGRAFEYTIDEFQDTEPEYDKTGNFKRYS